MQLTKTKSLHGAPIKFIVLYYRIMRERLQALVGTSSPSYGDVLARRRVA